MWNHQDPDGTTESGETPVIVSIKLVDESYRKSIIPRSLVMLIPYIGSSIDHLLSGKATRRWEKNVEDFLRQTKDRLDRLGEEKIDKAFVQTEEFECILVNILQALSHTYEKEKVRYFAAVLVGSVAPELPERLQRHRYVELVSQLSAIHMRILAAFGARRRSRKGAGGRESGVFILTADELGAKIGADRVTTEAFCADLTARGLLYDPQLGLSQYKRGSYALHPSAFTFVDIVTELATEESQAEDTRGLY